MASDWVRGPALQIVRELGEVRVGDELLVDFTFRFTRGENGERQNERHIELYRDVPFTILSIWREAPDEAYGGNFHYTPAGANLDRYGWGIEWKEVAGWRRTNAKQHS